MTTNPHGGRRNEVAARNGKRVGPRIIPIADRKRTHGKISILQDVPTLLLAERLAAIIPTCTTVEAVIALAVAKLAEHTDD